MADLSTQIGEDPDVPAQIVPALQAALGDRLWAIVLFGSRARGDHHPASDWDLFVIAEGLPEPVLERYRALKGALPPGVRGATAILATSPEAFEARVSDVYLDIALDGQILYDPSRYLARKLAELRRIIDKAGLYRERTPAGDIWNWRVPPPTRWSIDWEL